MRRSAILSRLCGGVLLIAGLSLAPSSARAQNVLANPGFETGAVAGQPDNGVIPSWSSFGNAYNTFAPNPLPPGPHAGNGALKEFGTFPGVSGAFQSFPATPGQLWQMTGFGLNASSDAMQAENFGELKISFQDAGNNEILGVDGNHIDINTPQNVWTPLFAQGIAPAGVNHVNLFALLVQPNFNGGSAFFDDLSGGLVPEPGTFALLGAGALLPLRRRRR